MTAGSVPSTSPITASFPAIQVLSPSPFPTRKAGHSTAIRPYGSLTGKRVSSRQREEVSFITVRPAAFSLARSDPSRRHLPSQASHSSSGEGGHSAVLIRIIGRWESVLTQTDGELQTALLLQNDGGCLATKDRELPANSASRPGGGGKDKFSSIREMRDLCSDLVAVSTGYCL